MRKLIAQVPRHPIDDLMAAKGFDPGRDLALFPESMRESIGALHHRAIRFSPLVPAGSLVLMRQPSEMAR